MSQGDIIDVLEKKKEPLTARELSEYLEIRQETIMKALRKLVEHGEVKARKITSQEKKQKGYGTNVNNRFRVFFVES